MSKRSQDASDDIEDENPLCVASTKPTDCNEKNKNANKQNNTYVTLSVRDQGEKALIDETATFGCHQDTSYSHADDDSWTASSAQTCFDIDEAIWQEDAISNYGDDYEKKIFLNFSLDLPKTGDDKCYASFADTFSGRQVTPNDIEDEKHVSGAPTKLPDRNNNNFAIKVNGNNQAICVDDQGEEASISDANYSYSNADDDSWTASSAEICFYPDDAILQEDASSKHEEDYEKEAFLKASLDLPNTGDEKCYASFADTFSGRQVTPDDIEDEKHVSGAPTKLSDRNNNNFTIKVNGNNQAICVEGEKEKASTSDAATGWYLEYKSGNTAVKCFDICDTISQKEGQISNHKDDWPTSLHQTNDMLLVNPSNCGWAGADVTAWNQSTNYRYQVAFKDMEVQIIQSTELSKKNSNLKENIISATICVKDKTEKRPVAADTFSGWHRKDNSVSLPHKTCKVSIEFCRQINEVSKSKKRKVGENDLPLIKRRGANCTFPNCDSFVRRGGVCARHGAKLATCKFPAGCSNVVVNRNLCKQHGAMKTSRKICSIPSCGKQARTGGTCVHHGSATKKCSYNECTNIVVKGGVCIRHGAKKGVANIIKKN